MYQESNSLVALDTTGHDISNVSVAVDLFDNTDPGLTVTCNIGIYFLVFCI